MGAALGQGPRGAQRQRALHPPWLRGSEEQADGAEAGVVRIRPTEQPDLRKTQVFQNPLHVRGRSIRLEARPPATDPAGPPATPRSWTLSFYVDSRLPAEAVVHVGLLGAVNGPEGAWASRPAAVPEGLSQECRVDLALDSVVPEAPPGRRQPPREVSFCIELRAAASAEPAEPAEAGAEGAEGGDLGAFELTLGSLTLRRPNAGVAVRAQRVRLPGAGPLLETREVFGAELGPALLGQDCVICMSEMRDTAVLPCRHMCLCGGCAETMRSAVQYRSYRCPICRERVSSLLQIQRTPDDHPPDGEAGAPAPEGAAPVAASTAVEQ